VVNISVFCFVLFLFLYIGGDQSASVETKPQPAPEMAASSYDAGGRIDMEDRVAMVEQIIAESDYYSILGLERSCAQNEIRRAYISVIMLLLMD
jgi:hypothetical protein